MEFRLVLFRSPFLLLPYRSGRWLSCISYSSQPSPCYSMSDDQKLNYCHQTDANLTLMRNCNLRQDAATRGRDAGFDGAGGLPHTARTVAVAAGSTPFRGAESIGRAHV